MTRFDPKKNHKSPEDWSEEAYKITTQNNLQFHVIGGLVVSVLIAGATTPVTGGLVAAYALWTAWKKSGEIQRNQAAILDSGCIAQALEGDSFRDYLDQVGHDAVMAELKYAQNRELAISNDALDYIEDHGADTKQSLQPKQYQVNRDTAPQLQAPVVNTRVATYNPHDQYSIDIVSEMTDRIQNIFGVGQGGSGKGMLLANACRAVKAKHPGKKIFLIDGKDDPKEHEYFDGIVDAKRRLHCETAKPSKVAEWFEDAIARYDKFAAENNGALLVIDEGTIIGARLKEAKSNALNDKIIGITSCGGSMGKNIWVFAQTPFAGAGGTNLTSLSQMTKVVIVRGDAVGVLDEWKRAAIFRKFDPQEVDKLARNSECNRVVYWGGSASWYSMPKLVNYSAYDRDTETYIKDVVAPTTIQNLEDSFKASNNISEEVNKQSELSVPAQKVLEWLQANRANQWVKYKGVDRDQSFINLARKHGYTSQESIFDELITELIVIETIDLDETTGAILIL